MDDWCENGRLNPISLLTSSVASPTSSVRPPNSSFVRKHVPDSDPGCAYAAFERAVEPLHSAISSFRPLNSSFPRRRESRGEVRVVAMTLELSHQPMHPNFHTLVRRQQPA